MVAVRKYKPVYNARILELDGIRGVAIGLVLIWHFVVNRIPCVPGTASGYFMKMLHHTYSGVDLFFVLSGFLILRILLQTIERKHALKVFWIRRCFRIMPLYFLYLGIGLLLATCTKIPSFQLPAEAWTYPLFIQSISMVQNHSLGNWGLTWSLAIEEQFYLIMPFVLKFARTENFLKIMFCLLIVSPFIRWSLWSGEDNDFKYFVLLPCRLDGFAVGGLLAWLSLNPAKLNWFQQRPWFGHAALVLSFLLVLAITIRKAPYAHYDHLILALFYGALMLLCLTNTGSIIAKSMRTRWLRWIGVISYPLYLFHEIEYKLLEATSITLTTTAGGRCILALLGTFASVITAGLLHRYIGNPLVRVGRDLSNKVRG